MHLFGRRYRKEQHSSEGTLKWQWDDVFLFRVLTFTCNLFQIDLSCNKLTDEGCVTLASALKGNNSVTFLRLWGNVKISNAGFDTVKEMLEQNCQLERIPLMAPLGYENRISNPSQKNAKAHAA